MKWRPPVCTALLPSVRTLRFVSFLAFCPFAVVGARALIPHKTMAVAFALVIFGLASMTLARNPARHRTILASAPALAGIPAFAIVHAAVHTSTVSARMALVAAVVAAIITGASLRAALRSFANASPEALDARAVPAVATAFWLAIAALLTRVGSTVGHLHLVFPQLSLLLATAALTLAVIATAALFGQRRWTRRLYANEVGTLSVGPIPRDIDAESLAPLSAGDSDAAIRMGTTQGVPYRDDPSAVARVPSSPERLLSTYTRAARMAGTACAASMLGLVLWPHASAAHSAELASVPTALPRRTCSPGGHWPPVRLVALEPLRLVDIEQIAERYRRAGLPDVRVEKPMDLQDRFFDRRRHQLNGEDIAVAAAREYPSTQPPGPWWDEEILIVLTDRDMFVPSVPWPYALAAQNASGVVVISLARMDPSFPLVATETYTPERPSCAAALHERAYKMITRRILMGTFGASAWNSISGLSELDGLHEAEEIAWCASR